MNSYFQILDGWGLLFELTTWLAILKLQLYWQIRWYHFLLETLKKMRCTIKIYMFPYRRKTLGWWYGVTREILGSKNSLNLQKFPKIKGTTHKEKHATNCICISRKKNKILEQHSGHTNIRRQRENQLRKKRLQLIDTSISQRHERTKKMII